jgi:hypothetical protein
LTFSSDKITAVHSFPIGHLRQAHSPSFTPLCGRSKAAEMAFEIITGLPACTIRMVMDVV